MEGERQKRKVSHVTQSENPPKSDDLTEKRACLTLASEFKIKRLQTPSDCHGVSQSNFKEGRP
jgi:hypothetical protein